MHITVSSFPCCFFPSQNAVSVVMAYLSEDHGT